ncbi:MAG TPA: methyltransferase domain-containing protein, partial [Gaiellales bacterium]|nr:methyltransferase domain-containing protein [Gaiellales bacterium]
EALRERLPDVEAARASAEALPFRDGVFDAALAQLVVHFMTDPVAGLREMARVSRPGGVVAACVWDHAGERSPIAVLWRAAREFDSGVHDESDLAGAREGHLVELLRAAGLERVEATELEAPFAPATFEEWWEPFTLGVGPAGGYLAGLDEERQAAVRERSRAEVGDGPFSLPAFVWAVRGVSPAR